MDGALEFRNALLCIDDEALVLLSLKTELRHHFANRLAIYTALDGEEANRIFDFCTEERFENLIVISDLLIPGTTGIHLIEQFLQKQHPFHLVFVTGTALPKIPNHWRDTLLSYQQFPKPWEHSLLVSHMEPILI